MLRLVIVNLGGVVLFLYMMFVPSFKLDMCIIFLKIINTALPNYIVLKKSIDVLVERRIPFHSSQIMQAS